MPQWLSLMAPSPFTSATQAKRPKPILTIAITLTSIPSVILTFELSFYVFLTIALTREPPSPFYEPTPYVTFPTPPPTPHPHSINRTPSSNAQAYRRFWGERVTLQHVFPGYIAPGDMVGCVYCPRDDGQCSCAIRFGAEADVCPIQLV